MILTSLFRLLVICRAHSQTDAPCGVSKASCFRTSVTICWNGPCLAKCSGLSAAKSCYSNSPPVFARGKSAAKPVTSRLPSLFDRLKITTGYQ